MPCIHKRATASRLQKRPTPTASAKCAGRGLAVIKRCTCEMPRAFDAGLLPRGPHALGKAATQPTWAKTRRAQGRAKAFRPFRRQFAHGICVGSALEVNASFYASADQFNHRIQHTPCADRLTKARSCRPATHCARSQRGYFREVFPEGQAIRPFIPTQGIKWLSRLGRARSCGGSLSSTPPQEALTSNVFFPKDA